MFEIACTIEAIVDLSVWLTYRRRDAGFRHLIRTIRSNTFEAADVKQLLSLLASELETVQALPAAERLPYVVRTRCDVLNFMSRSGWLDAEVAK